MGCCGRKFGRTIRRTSSIFDKIIEDRKINEYIKAKKELRGKGLIWTKGDSSNSD